MDSTISVLVDLTGANERIFKSPIPLVYTRLTARFLSVFLTLLPLAMWAALGESWNHWATIPATFILSIFLFGVEEVGIQIEEPFSILPLEAMCTVPSKPFSWRCSRPSSPAQRQRAGRGGSSLPPS